MDGAIGAARHLMESAESQPATRQAVIDVRHAERQKTAGNPASGLNPADLFPKGGLLGRGGGHGWIQLLGVWYVPVSFLVGFESIGVVTAKVAQGAQTLGIAKTCKQIFFYRRWQPGRGRTNVLSFNGPHQRGHHISKPHPMPMKIIPRRLTVTQNGKERGITEGQLFALGSPLVILGDPGMGKTYLMNSLAQQLGTKRVAAGSFARNAHPEKLLPPGGQPFVFDGLDELATSFGASAVDDILKTLSALNLPPFILSCRAADWQGSADRQKIADDYGVVPITARLEPFSRADAKACLTDWPVADADQGRGAL